MSPSLVSDQDTLNPGGTWTETLHRLRQGQSWSGGERNRVFWNLGGTDFADMAHVSGIGLPDDARAAAVGDWDGDGDPDLWVTNRSSPRLKFFRNVSATEHSRVTLLLEGTAPTTNRDAIGARVEVVTDTSGDLRLVKELTAGSGFLAQSSKQLHFGLGDATRIERVIVHWPGAEPETFNGCEPGGRFKLVQGTGSAVPAPFPATEVATSTTEPSWKPRPGVRFSDRIPFPTLDYGDVAGDGTGERLRPGGGRAVAVTLWSGECPDCRAELTEWSRDAAVLEEAGIDLLALCVDGLDVAQGTDPAASAEWFAGLRLPSPFHRASRWTLSQVEGLRRALVHEDIRFVTPTTVLIDAEGGLAALYEGRVSTHQLAEDVQPLPSDATEAREQVALAPGRELRHPRVLSIETRRALAMRKDVAQLLLAAGRGPEALSHAHRVAELWPEHPAARLLLGKMLDATGQAERATEEVRRATELDSTEADAHAALGTLLARSGHHDEAEASLRRARELEPRNAAALTGLGTLAEAAGDVDAAYELYREASNADRTDAAARLNLARLQVARGETSDAAHTLSVALVDDTADARIARRYAWICATAPDAMLRDGDRAVRWARHAVDRIRPDLRPLAQVTLAAALAESGDLDAARALLDEILGNPALDTDTRSRLESFADDLTAGRPIRDPALGD